MSHCPSLKLLRNVSTLLTRDRITTVIRPVNFRSFGSRTLNLSIGRSIVCTKVAALVTTTEKLVIVDLRGSLNSYKLIFGSKPIVTVIIAYPVGIVCLNGI